MNRKGPTNGCTECRDSALGFNLAPVVRHRCPCRSLCPHQPVHESAVRHEGGRGQSARQAQRQRNPRRRYLFPSRHWPNLASVNCRQVWIFLSSQAMFWPRASIVGRASSSCSTSPLARPKLSFFTGYAASTADESDVPACSLDPPGQRSYSHKRWLDRIGWWQCEALRINGACPHLSSVSWEAETGRPIREPSKQRLGRVYRPSESAYGQLFSPGSTMPESI